MHRKYLSGMTIACLSTRRFFTLIEACFFYKETDHAKTLDYFGDSSANFREYADNSVRSTSGKKASPRLLLCEPVLFDML
jgi:hypothetical protein